MDGRERWQLAVKEEEEEEEERDEDGDVDDNELSGGDGDGDGGGEIWIVVDGAEEGEPSVSAVVGAGEG